jgi:hypothetical protein
MKDLDIEQRCLQALDALGDWKGSVIIKYLPGPLMRAEP